MLVQVPTKVGLLLVQARRKACMGWSWATACSVQGRGHIVAASRLQLVLLDKGCHVVMLTANAAAAVTV